MYKQSRYLGILLFLVEIAILCWVKFWFKDHTVAWVATGLLIPILVIFVGFAAHFYLKLVAHKSEVSNIQQNIYNKRDTHLEKMLTYLLNKFEHTFRSLVRTLMSWS